MISGKILCKEAPILNNSEIKFKISIEFEHDSELNVSITVASVSFENLY